MKIRKKWRLWYFVFLIVISTAVSVYRVKQESTLPIDENELNYDTGYLHGIRKNGSGKFTFYKADKQGTIEDSMDWTFQTPEDHIIEMGYIADQNPEDLYWYYEIDSQANVIANEVLSWNHEARSLDLMADIKAAAQDKVDPFAVCKDGETLAYYGISQLSDNCRYYFYHLEENNTKAVFDGMMDGPVNTIDGVYYENYGWIVTNQDGDFFRFQNQNISMIFTNNDILTGFHNVLEEMGDGYLVLRNLDKKEDISIPYDNPKNISRYPYEPYIEIEGKQYPDKNILTHLRNADGSFRCAFLGEDDGTSSFYYADEGQAGLIHEIRYPFSNLCLKGMINFAVCFALGLAVFFMLWIWIEIYHGRTSLYVNIFLIMLILVDVVTKVVYNQNYQRIASDILASEMANQYREAASYISHMDLDVLEQMALGESKAGDSARRDLFQDKPVNLTNDVYNLSTQTIEPFSRHLIFSPQYYLLQEGEIYIIESNGTTNIPIQYGMIKKPMEAVQKSIEQNAMIPIAYSVGGQAISSLIMPIRSSDNTVLGAIEVRQAGEQIEQDILAETQDLRNYQTICYVILLLALMLILYVLLRPIKKLTVMAEQLGKGNLDVRMKVHGNDELTEISAVFNQMAEGISKHLTELQRYTDCYSKFLPNETFKVMGKENITQVLLWDEKNIQGATLAIATNLYEQQLSDQSGQNLFDFMNDALGIQLPYVERREGIVDTFENAGIKAYFVGGAEQALKTAIDAVDKLNRSKLRMGGQEARFQASIGFGLVHVGVVGNPKRMDIQNISEEGNLTAFLRKIAENYGAEILILEEAAKQIPLFGMDYRVRTLGYVRVTSSKSLRLVYEVFDTNRAKARMAKEQTLEQYEKGVRLFQEGKAAEARNCFVQVLRMDKFDKAAQKYFYLCDRYMNEQNTDYDRWIEEY